MKSFESSIVSKTCTKCGQTLPLESFGKHAKGKFGRRSICRSCVSKHMREYHRTPRGRDVVRKSRARFAATERGKQWRRAKAQRHREQNPHKAKARSAVSQAIEAGRLERPEACSNCGTVGMVEAHHFNGYSKEHWLDVQWLCKSCHLQEDGQVAQIESVNRMQL